MSEPGEQMAAAGAVPDDSETLVPAEQGALLSLTRIERRPFAGMIRFAVDQAARDNTAIARLVSTSGIASVVHRQVAGLMVFLGGALTWAGLVAQIVVPEGGGIGAVRAVVLRILFATAIAAWVWSAIRMTSAIRLARRFGKGEGRFRLQPPAFPQVARPRLVTWVVRAVAADAFALGVLMLSRQSPYTAVPGVAFLFLAAEMLILSRSPNRSSRLILNFPRRDADARSPQGGGAERGSARRERSERP
jgi:hypothetical protein